jgi:hypothetical protein
VGAFKTLNAQDVLISPLELNKGFNFDGGSSLIEPQVNIERFLGKNVDFEIDKSTTGINNEQYQSLVYSQIKQLYYSNYISGSNGEISLASTASFNPDTTITGPFYSTIYENYLQSDLDSKRFFPTSSNDLIGILSIPRRLFGDYIQPTSLKIIEGSNTYIDDGEGRLILNSNFVGNIIYPHGIVVLTGGDRSEVGNNQITNFVENSNIKVSFSSSYTIYETQYKCTINEDEFNFSQNPSILIDNNGNPLEFVGTDYFQPYITTIGLYNNSKELMAVAKLSKPLMVSPTTDTTILVNIDHL